MAGFGRLHRYRRAGLGLIALAAFFAAAPAFAAGPAVRDCASGAYAAGAAARADELAALLAGDKGPHVPAIREKHRAWRAEERSMAELAARAGGLDFCKAQELLLSRHAAYIRWLRGSVDPFDAQRLGELARGHGLAPVPYTAGKDRHETLFSGLYAGLTAEERAMADALASFIYYCDAFSEDRAEPLSGGVSYEDIYKAALPVMGGSAAKAGRVCFADLCDLSLRVRREYPALFRMFVRAYPAYALRTAPPGGFGAGSGAPGERLADMRGRLPDNREAAPSGVTAASEAERKLLERLGAMDRMAEDLGR